MMVDDNTKSLSLKKYFIYCVNLACICFVSWKGLQCFIRFLEEPEGTTVSIEYAGKNPFPALTICAQNGEDRWNESHLKFCGINGIDDYKDNATWTGVGSSENCTNPKLLYESLVPKVENIIEYIEYHYYGNEIEYEMQSNSENQDFWSHVDHSVYGRCYTTSSNVKMKEHNGNGIRKMTLKIKTKVKLFFHTPNMFHTTGKLTTLYIDKPGDILIDLEHEVFEFTKFMNQECIKDKSYNDDMFTIEEFERNVMKDYGCTTPFGQLKDNICKDPTIGMKVFSLQKPFIDKHRGDFEIPCVLINSQAIIAKHQINPEKPNRTKLNILFQDKIKVTRQFYVYSGLSMMADIGGYVGLFLGISINQIPALFDFGYEIFKKCFKTF